MRKYLEWLNACGNYTLVLYLLTPLLLVRLALLGVRNRGYWERWRERLGFVPALPAAGPNLWVHAVSVGEAQAASALVRALRARIPRDHDHGDHHDPHRSGHGAPPVSG